MSLVGHMIWLAARDKEGENVSHYHDGEYFCLRETLDGVYVAWLGGGYGSHEIKYFSKRKYDITDEGVDIAGAEAWLDELEHFAKTPQRDERLRWVGSVYNGARDVVRQARKALASFDVQCEPCCDAVCDQAEDPDAFAMAIRTLLQAGGRVSINVGLGV